MRRFNAAYAGLATGLLALEVLIARFAHDRFIRPYAGDFLVPVLLYCLVQSLGRRPVGWVLAAVLLVAYLVEMGQYFHLVARLGLAHSRGARLVLGSAFSWADILAYTLGALLVLGVERGRSRQAAV